MSTESAAVQLVDSAFAHEQGPAKAYSCLYECGALVAQPGYACEACAEAALPFELQKREGDHVFLSRERLVKAGSYKGQERRILLRPRNQEEKNDLKKASIALLAAAKHINANFSFATSAEGRDFWEAIVHMLWEKAGEMEEALKKKP
jgi:hypothetical protein